MEFKNKIKLEQFIGTFPNAINDGLCFEFVKWFDAVSNQGLTMYSSEHDHSPINRQDEVIHIPSGLTSSYFPTTLCKQLWSNIGECLKIYATEYGITQHMTSSVFKIHRVQPSGGYHIWHHEHDFENSLRVLAWHLTIESPKSGGDTQFLYQSMKIEPEVGKLLLWPAGFTHKHRGNPPLEGQKTYITGWFELIRPQHKSMERN